MHTAAPTTGFKEEEGLSVDETSSVGEVLSSDTESGVASVDVKEESEDGDCDGGGSDDGDLFQGFNDAPPLPAKIKKSSLPCACGAAQKLAAHSPLP